jgi:predicted regulator of Ras-like GTPase activity (Roadblock/LC7/MglB family)
MLNKSIFDEIRQIYGYVGAGISEYTGELLLFDKKTEDAKFEEAALIFNDVFRNSHTLSKQLELGTVEIMEVVTSNSKIVMACSGENSSIHLHAFAVFSKDGNVALAKLMMPKILKKAVSKLS